MKAWFKAFLFSAGSAALSAATDSLMHGASGKSLLFTAGVGAALGGAGYVLQSPFDQWDGKSERRER